MFDFLSDSTVKLVFWIGVALSLVSGFFAMSEGSAFRRTPGLLFLSLCFFGLVGALVTIAVSASIGSAVISLIVFWLVLAVGGGMMKSLIGR